VFFLLLSLGHAVTNAGTHTQFKESTQYVLANDAIVTLYRGSQPEPDSTY